MHIGFARWHDCGGVFRVLSGTGIDHDYDTADSNNIDTTPYEPRRGAEGSAVAVTDAVKSYSQSQADLFAFFRISGRLAVKWSANSVGYLPCSRSRKRQGGANASGEIRSVVGSLRGLIDLRTPAKQLAANCPLILLSLRFAFVRIRAPHFKVFL